MLLCFLRRRLNICEAELNLGFMCLMSSINVQILIIDLNMAVREEVRHHILVWISNADPDISELTMFLPQPFTRSAFIRYEHSDESVFWSVSHFSSVDLVAAWHGRGQRLWALTSQMDLPPCMHSSHKAGPLPGLEKSVSQEPAVGWGAVPHPQTKTWRRGNRTVRIVHLALH